MWIQAEIKSHSDEVELIINCAYGLGAIGAIVEVPFLAGSLDLGAYTESHSESYLVIATFEAPFVRRDRALFRRRLNHLSLKETLSRIRYHSVGPEIFQTSGGNFFQFRDSADSCFDQAG